MTPRRIAVLTTDPLPVPGSPTTGAGLRAWGLAEGLRARGHDVAIADPLNFGRGQIIWSLADGVLVAGSEPRADAYPLGW